MHRVRVDRAEVRVYSRREINCEGVSCRGRNEGRALVCTRRGAVCAGLSVDVDVELVGSSISARQSDVDGVSLCHCYGWIGVACGAVPSWYSSVKDYISRDRVGLWYFWYRGVNPTLYREHEDYAEPECQPGLVL